MDKAKSKCKKSLDHKGLVIPLGGWFDHLNREATRNLSVLSLYGFTG